MFAILYHKTGHKYLQSGRQVLMQDSWLDWIKQTGKVYCVITLIDAWRLTSIPPCKCIRLCDAYSYKLFVMFSLIVTIPAEWLILRCTAFGRLLLTKYLFSVKTLGFGLLV